ncbi:MAG: hypothetical protein SGPRY_003998 [Prymnesium sp.]
MREEAEREERADSAPTTSVEDEEPLYDHCLLDPITNEIESCSVISEEELQRLVGEDQADRIRNDPVSANLFFTMSKKEVVEGEESEEAVMEEEMNVFTMSDWTNCYNDDTCEIPPDILLRNYGVDRGGVMIEEQMAEENLNDANSEELRRFHLHFGAGRLGMGLVLPAIAGSGIPFALVQRAKPRWEEMFQAGIAKRQADQDAPLTGIRVSINNEVTVQDVKLVTKEDAHDMLPPKSLVIGSDKEQILTIVEKATSFSCSLGAAMAKVLVPILDELPETERDHQPLLFACENDHAAVMRLKKRLEGKVHVVDCMVDRVCTVVLVCVQDECGDPADTIIDPQCVIYSGRSISESGVDVEAEPFTGSIVVLEPNLKERVPFTPKVAMVPSSEREAQYYSDRKLSLVNGMHTVLAFMTLCQQYETPQNGEQREYILLKYDEMERADQRVCEVWRAARIAELVQLFNVSAIMEWHGCETKEEAWEVLFEYADYTLSERFSKVDDVVSRVLGGGVANRWLGRLRPVEQYFRERLEQGKAGKDETSELLLYAMRRDRERAERMGTLSAEDQMVDSAEAAEEYVLSCLSNLTLASRRFCAREFEVTNKGLIKQQRVSGGKKFSPLVQNALKQVEAKRLRSRYAKIAAALPRQRAAYEAWLASGAVDGSGLVSKAAAMGLDLDLPTGRISYAADFESKRVDLNFELVFCRHGQTEANTEPRVFQGFVDEAQNALKGVGLEQAHEAADKLDALQLDPDLIVLSPLSRAAETGLAFVRRHPHLENRVEYWDEAAQMCFGAWENRVVKDLHEELIAHLFYLDQNAVVKSDEPYIRPNDGTEFESENFLELLERMRSVLERVNMQMAPIAEQRARPPSVIMYGHSMTGAALSILTGNGKKVEGGRFLGFEGEFILPNATPVYLHKMASVFA